LAFLAAACAASPSQNRLEDGIPPPLREVLPNGLRLIVQPHRGGEVVALHLWIGVGARDEGPEERGFSHFAEHMLFKGTLGLGPGFVDREVEAVGGRTNAGTSLDYTFYHMLLPAHRAQRGIEVLAEMALHSTFDPTEIERERQVVFEEMRLNEDRPRRALGRGLYEALFAGHPYGLSVLGDKRALEAATRESLRGYYARHYRGDTMTLVVVGAVDPVAARETARRVFAAAPTRGSPRASPPTVVSSPRGERRVVERPERQAWVGMAWVAPALGHADMFAVDLLAYVLGGSRSSRLAQSLRERTRIASSAEASYAALHRAGVVTVVARCEPGNVEAVEEAIIAEVRRIQDDGVSEAERDRAVTVSESRHIFSTETAEGLAYAYGHAETLWSLEAERSYLERLRAVTAPQIRQVAQRYLAAPPARLIFLPKSRS
jgi:zinc protease